MNPWNDTALSVPERVEALIGAMSRKEKIHQLASFWERDEDEDVPAPEPAAAGEDGSPAGAGGPEGHQVAPMADAFAVGRLSWEESIDGGLGQLTRVFGTDPVSVPDGVAKLVRLERDVVSHNAFGIPALAHEECLTGFTALGATVYPAAIAWGATWRPELIKDMAGRIGADLRAVGIHQGLAPLLDVVRDYRWGRVEETCGEDPYLVGTLGTAYVQGLQEQGILATLKHFAAYPASKAGRNHAPVEMGTRELEDIMLPPFEMAVREGGAASVMNSYSDIDGEPAAASRHLLTEVLRERWGFTGTVVSDYWSVRFLEAMHHVAEDYAHAAALAVRAGLDVELPETTCYAGLSQAIDSGLLTEAELDTAVRRVLTQKVRLGLLDPDWDPSADPARNLDSAANRAVARRLAEESVVLLKNDGVLPLAPSTRVAVAGPVWEDERSFLGCYSFPNHVLSRDGGRHTGLEIRTLPDALRVAFEKAPTFHQGVGFIDGRCEDFDAAVAAARAADVAVVTLGDIAGLFGGGTSGEGCDVVDLTLPGQQGELLDAILATGTPTVLVLVTGRPYALGRYAERCAAIVQAFMPGVEGADAITGVLTGAINPSGRLPVAIPNGPGGQPGTYLAAPLAWRTEGVSNLDPTPLYPFGAGESYSTFTLSQAEVSAPTMPVDGQVDYSVTVTNTSGPAGAEVVQLYLTDPVAEVVRPMKQLIGFAKVDLEPGQSKRVTFTVDADRTSFTGVGYERVVEPGEIRLAAGRSSEARLEPLSVQITGERRVVGEGRVLTTPVTVTD
ncbi:glycoside hydrolase family 3 N-terminal domain-containing protein [Actinomyces sp. MRS3W]|uniref:glycoside hydrolase family 3 N-terminal domain-containing protein n=1 Tax=Actinomyces sp. MRS3W TaxID=2800796 RepID=UPI0028FD9B62|nr:glycoside hydrolase family 3 N-terminal domain-containing protein [Actinomyces sp. MRS3W]MDU0348730.1 glycoside hydrolase family 3 N-terminal domain-containing protein [Actinomyces sp. MRS3W]